MNRVAKVGFLAFLLHFLVEAFFAQLGSQELPIPVTSNQIVGVIKPRRVGDDRLTRLFYSLDTDKGDLFINVEAENLDADLDLFIASNLRPLAKIVIYAADMKTETSRVVYLRKPEKLLLRIEGRTPNDNPAKFRIKFAGSFVARDLGISERTSEDSEKNKAEGIAALKSNIQEKAEEETERLNKDATDEGLKEEASEAGKEVGKQVEFKEKQQYEKAEGRTEIEVNEDQARQKLESEEKEGQEGESARKSVEGEQAIEGIEEKIEEKRITEDFEKEDEASKVLEKELRQQTQEVENTEKGVGEKRIVEGKNEVVAEGSGGDTEKSGERQSENVLKQGGEPIEEDEEAKRETRKTEVSPEEVTKTKREEKSEKTERVGEKAVFANMFLVVIFKDGTKLEKPMQEVLSFRIDEENLVVVTKDGKADVRKASDVLQVTIK